MVLCSPIPLNFCCWLQFLFTFSIGFLVAVFISKENLVGVGMDNGITDNFLSQLVYIYHLFRTPSVLKNLMF
jgi:hypothetical protein